MPKYIVSSTLQGPQWSDATVLGGEAVEEISELKRKVDGEILVYASYQLMRTMMDHDLVDELRLVVFPVVAGSGLRLFDETSNTKPLRLVNTSRLGDTLVFYAYAFARDKQL
jgi:dihydrofolate reductase